VSSSSTTQWLRDVRHRIEEIGGRWLTRSEFRTVLEDLLGSVHAPISRIIVAFKSPPPFRDFAVDAGIDQPDCPEANEKWEFDLNDGRPTKCDVRFWNKPDTRVPRGDFRSGLESLLSAFWKPELRTKAAGIPDMQRAGEVASYAEVTLASRPEGTTAAVLFCDLDNFKQFNTDYGHEVGTRVIREFGAAIDASAGDNAIVLHNGGDEFVLFSPTGGAVGAIKLAHLVSRAVKESVASCQEGGLGISIGVAISRQELEGESFSRLVQEADSILTGQVKAAGPSERSIKGSMRFPLQEPMGTDLDWSLDALCSFAKCVVKSSALEPAPFSNVWLNGLSLAIQAFRCEAREFSAEGTQRTASAFLDWVKAEVDERPLHTSFFGYGTDDNDITAATISPLECAFAIAHGLLRVAPGAPTAPEIVLKFNDSGSTAGIVTTDDILVWSVGDITTCSQTLRFGTAALEPTELTGCATRARIGARAVLVKIGHDDLGCV